jgi:tocopherol cyclase
MAAYFEGTYYKHQKDGQTVCFIYGKTNSSSFIQVITNNKSYQFFNESKCSFGKNGICINLPDIKGNIAYSNLTPIKYDIMGPFKYLPMECRHKIISMYHKLNGSITIEDQFFDFTDGNGYIEGDSGHSFPEKYLWIHSNDFPEKCSIMVSVAKIPFYFTSFMGCIAIVYFKEKEYRFASYLGAKILALSHDMLLLKQGKYVLEVIISRNQSHPLASPVKGKMDRVIYESNTAEATFRMYKNGELLFELASNNTSLEIEGI